MGNDDMYSTAKNLTGKTIASFETIGAEYGRTFNQYCLFTFTDGTRAIIAGSVSVYRPDPHVEEMRKAPKFFSAQEIADKVLREELDFRDRQKRERENRKAEYARLRMEFGSGDESEV